MTISGPVAKSPPHIRKYHYHSAGHGRELLVLLGTSVDRRSEKSIAADTRARCRICFVRMDSVVKVQGQNMPIYYIPRNKENSEEKND